MAYLSQTSIHSMKSGRSSRRSVRSSRRSQAGATMMELLAANSNVGSNIWNSNSFMMGSNEGFGAFERGKWLPDPENSLQEQREENADSTLVLTPRSLAAKKEEARRELLIQEYWKQHASPPDAWPTFQNVLENCRSFERNFRNAAYSFDGKGNARKLHFKMAFAVTSLHKVAVRETPTLDMQAARPGVTLDPGSCIVVDAIAAVAGDRYVKLLGGGWVFESINGYQVLACMENAEVGLWWYQLVSYEYVEVRRMPTLDDASRTGYLLCPKETIVVCCRCRINGIEFLRLADGRGWVFMYRPQMDTNETLMAERQISIDETFDPTLPLFHECIGELGTLIKDSEDKEDGNSKSVSVIERGFWIYQVLHREVLVIGSYLHGEFLAPGEKLIVDMRVPASGKKTKEVSSKGATNILSRIWLRMDEGKGWFPKTDKSNQPLVKFLGIAEPSRKLRVNVMPNVNDWSVGVA